jgi:hypothetical protein
VTAVGGMRKRNPVTQSNKRLSGWIKGLQGQPGWDSLRECLEQIAAGQDANKVFGLNRGRGRNAKQAERTFRKNMVRIWVASAIREFDIKRPEAIIRAAVAFGLDEDTVARYAQGLGRALEEHGNFDYDALLPKT